METKTNQEVQPQIQDFISFELYLPGYIIILIVPQ